MESQDTTTATASNNMKLNYFVSHNVPERGAVNIFFKY